MANRRRNNNNRPGNGGDRGGYRPQNNKATVFDSNGPDVRIRGTAYQIVEKYTALAKDAASSGDRVLAENYLQHAEHYQRLIGSWAEETPRVYNDTRPEMIAPDETVGENTDAVVTRPVQKQAPVPADDDLGLPASILGGAAPKAEGNTRTSKATRVAIAG